MSFDREQFFGAIREGRKKQATDMLPQLKAAQAVASVMESLMTGDGSWDRYLQHVQALKDQADAARRRAETRMRDPSIWEPAHLAKLKSDLIAAEAMSEAFDLVMKLPKLLIENAEVAKQTIARFGGNDEEAAGQGNS